MTEPKRLFGPQHWNAIAKDIRREFTWITHQLKYDEKLARSDTLVKLAVSFARRFQKDNPTFDSVVWLNQCSPNVDLYPLGELWDITSERV